MQQIKILTISGSLRKESFNSKLLHIAMKIAEGKGAQVTEFLLESDLPIYNQDIQDAGFPDSVMKLKTAAESADLLLISTPEYNHSVPGGLKNAIDWLSRGKNSLGGKTAAIFGASDGIGGTIRSQLHLRQILQTLNVFVIPYPEVFVRRAQDLFDGNGNFNDEKTLQQLDKLITKAIDITRRLNQPTQE